MRFLVTSIIFTIILSITPAFAAQKIASEDDRIKTFVYDSSEVFRVVSRSGFQTAIEFNKDETIETVSIGDSIGWQLTPAGKRLFLKPLHKSGITNLSVITNRRSYQFELVATSSTNLNSSHSYVVKFYYPEAGESYGSSPQIMPTEQTRGYIRPVSATPIPQIPVASAPLPAPTINTPLPGEGGVNPFSAPAPASAATNYKYSMTGPDSIAPLKVYDNGRSTFFQFGNVSATPQILAVGANGEEFPLTSRTQNGQVIVDAVAPKLAIRQGRDVVFIYNENKAIGY